MLHSHTHSKNTHLTKPLTFLENPAFSHISPQKIRYRTPYRTNIGNICIFLVLMQKIRKLKIRHGRGYVYICRIKYLLYKCIPRKNVRDSPYNKIIFLIFCITIHHIMLSNLYLYSPVSSSHPLVYIWKCYLYLSQ